MANQLYTNAFVSIDGAVLLQEASVSVSRATGSQPVITAPLGYAGESPGASTMEVDVTNAVPTADFEFDAGAKMKSLKEVELTIYAAGKRLVSKGVIVADTFKHAANSESTYEFKFRGAFAEWSA
jgi:hypothetical protein